MAFPPPGLSEKKSSKFINSLLKLEDNTNLNILKDNLYNQVSGNKKSRTQVAPSRRAHTKKPLNKDSQMYFNEKLYSTSPTIN